jgi:hypothetical protein
MVETTEQRQIRLALFASEKVEAKSDYRLAHEAVLQRTARLRTERLARDAARKPTRTKQAIASSSPKRSSKSAPKTPAARKVAER